MMATFTYRPRMGGHCGTIYKRCSHRPANGELKRNRRAYKRGGDLPNSPTR